MAVNRRAIRRRSENPRSWKPPRPGPVSTSPPPPSSPGPRRPRRPRPLDPGDVQANPPAPDATRGGLEAAIDDFTRAWERGEAPQAEGYVDRLPVEDQAELVYHEYCLAEAAGLGPDPGDYLRRFPEQAGPLGRLFSLHGAFSDSRVRDLVARGAATLPEAGDEIGPYRLARELGRGAFARVFLAEQADLGDRLVVVKVSTRASSEPKLLARARHAHIVEVLRQAEAQGEDGPLHLVCMPFLGGATLSAVLDARRALGRPARSGRDLLADLDRVAAAEYPTVAPDRLGPAEFPASERTRPAREVIAGLSHARALAWVVSRLAEALDHAHRRGVTHGDLKPSNILLTADGTPMLFDFNLAVDRLEAEAEGIAAADSGGTLAYMAPERLRAIAEAGAPGPGHPGKGPEPHRADLYALGLVLLEALTGRRPPLPRGDFAGAPGLAAALLAGRGQWPAALVGPQGRSIPPALRSILAKCLAPDPLDRWRCDRRLAFAAGGARVGLARRARRYRPVLIGAALTLAVAVAVGLVASALIAGTKRDQALSKLSLIYDRHDSGAFGIGRSNTWQPLHPEIAIELSGRQLARYDAASDPRWPDRDDVRSLPDRERGELEGWLCEQAFRQARALGRRADSPADWRRAVALLDRTIARFPLGTLRSQRRELLDQLRLDPPAPSPDRGIRADPWMEAYLAGVAAEDLHAREALEHYADALRARPDGFWAHYRAAKVAARLDESPLAARHLRACVARWPNNPLLHAMLAVSLYHVEQSTLKGSRGNLAIEALAECERAIDIDPDFVPAYQLRAILRGASGNDEAVKIDLSRLALLRRPSSGIEDLKVRLGLVSYPGPSYTPIPTSIDILARQAIAADASDFEARAILPFGLVRDGRVEDAVYQYDQILESNPEDLTSRCEKAAVLRRVDPKRANEAFGDLIDRPRFEEVFNHQPLAIRAFHHFATDLLSQGKVEQALDVANRSLAHVLRNRALQTETIIARSDAFGPVLLAPQGETYYLLARIHAVACRTDRRRIDQVVDSLDRAFICDPSFRTVWFAKDRLFDDLREEIVDRIEDGPVDR